MEITPEIVRELLHYDPDTGIFTWRERARRWFKRERDQIAWNGKHAGHRAGYVWTSQATGFKRRHLALLGKTRLEHALAWMWMRDDPLPPQIDHENRDGTDNRWCNLRSANNAANCRNRSMRRTNRSGATGVDWYAKNGKWRARCTIEGKTHHLGLFSEMLEAKDAVAEFRSLHGFSAGHGTQLAHYHQQATEG